MPSPHSKQQGFLLVTVVVILAILASVAMLLSTSASMDNAVLARHVETAELDYTAEAALEHANWELAQNSSCSAFDGLPSTPFGAHSYSATVTPTSGSPVTLSASATHSSGAMRTLQSDVKTYQPNTVLTLQPDAAAGKDTHVYQWKSSWNYGTATALRVENRVAGDWSNGLLEFDVSAIPATATIISATLVLNQSSPSASGGDFSVHRVTSPWVEGVMSGGNGSPNWTTRDTSVAWATPGGDYDPAPVATINIPVGLQPHQWEVAALVQSWVSGESDNNGMAIVPASFGSDAFFHSSDATSAALRPSLEVTYACECGVGGTPQVQALQPGAALGKDAYLSASQERNFGAKGSMTLYEAGSARPVLEFDLSWLPPGAMVQSAQLETHAKTVASAGTADAHRITTPWIEGTCDDPFCTADGATWNTTDGTIPWVTPGGDHDMSSGASAAITTADSWVTWDVTSLVSDWVNGTYSNYGMLLHPYDGIQADISSSDASDPTLAPKLTVTFSCPCGATCVVGAGGGPGAGTTLLLTVGDATSLATQDSDKKTLIESWGYTVTLIDDNASQAEFDAAVATNSVAYVSATVFDTTLGAKLVNTSIGVVSEKATLVDEFGFSTYRSGSNQTTVSITENSHYISSVFPLGTLTLHSSPQPSFTLSGTLAAGLESLADGNGGEPGLAVLELGADLSSGGTAAGRRVKLPWGGAAFDHSLMNSDGETIMKRAIEWGAGASGAGTGSLPNRVLFVVGSVGGPGMTTEEVEHQALLESWGYIVQVIDDGASQTDFDAAVASNDVVFITNDVTASSIGTKLVNASIGVVTSEDNLSDEFGMASAIAWESGTAIEINDNSHYVTTPFATGLLTVLSSNESLAYVTGTLSTDLSKLASSSSGFGVVALAGSASMYGGGSSAGRRIQLPWGGNGFSPSSLNADGLTILKRALEWGTGAGDTASLAPLAHWKLDDSIGTTAIDSEGGHDGTLTNGPAWVTGTLSGAVSFDGTDDFIDLTSDAELDDVFVGGATATAWIKPAGWGENGYGRIFDKSSSPSATNDGWVIRMNVDNGGIINFGQGFSGGRGWWAIPNASISLDTWQHIAVVYDSSSTANDPVIYIDGNPLLVTEKDAPSGDIRSDAAINLRLGNYAGGTTHTFDGIIDDARIYDRMLDAAEVAALAAGGGGGGGGGGGMAGVLGFDTIFGSSQNNVRRLQIGTQVTLPEDGTVSGITAYVGNKDADVRYAIYSDVAGEPGALIAETPNALTSDAMQWLSIDLPATPLTAGTYWLVLSFHDTNQTYHYEAGGQTRYMSNRATANGFVANWGSSSFSDTRKISIYATYTP